MVEEHDFKKFPELTNNQIRNHIISPHPQFIEDFEAKVTKVHDGDTIRLRTDNRDFDFKLRLLDIDAPELNTGEPGIQAGNWLRDRILGEDVTIQMDPNNRVGKFGRLLGKVIHVGLDVGEEMLTMRLVTTFDARREGKLPDINKTFNTKQWLA